MLGLGAGGGRGSDVTAAIIYPTFIPSDGGLESRLNVTPSALVFVFFLYPDQLGVGVLTALLEDEVEGEGGDLFHARDGNLILEASIRSCFGQVVVHFAGAEKDLFDARNVTGGRAGLGDQPLEFRSGHHFVKTGFALGVAEK